MADKQQQYSASNLAAESDVAMSLRGEQPDLQRDVRPGVPAERSKEAVDRKTIELGNRRPTGAEVEAPVEFQGPSGCWIPAFPYGHERGAQAAPAILHMATFQSGGRQRLADVLFGDLQSGRPAGGHLGQMRWTTCAMWTMNSPGRTYMYFKGSHSIPLDSA